MLGSLLCCGTPPGRIRPRHEQWLKEREHELLIGKALLQPLPVKFQVSADDQWIVGTEDRADLLGGHRLIAERLDGPGDRSIQVPEAALARPTIPASAEPFLSLASPSTSLPGAHPRSSECPRCVPFSASHGSGACSRCPDISALLGQLHQRAFVPAGAPRATPPETARPHSIRLVMSQRACIMSSGDIGTTRTWPPRSMIARASPSSRGTAQPFRCADTKPPAPPSHRRHEARGDPRTRASPHRSPSDR
jgi:hypothetical protein